MAIRRTEHGVDNYIVIENDDVLHPACLAALVRIHQVGRALIVPNRGGLAEFFDDLGLGHARVYGTGITGDAGAAGHRLSLSRNRDEGESQ